MKQRLTQNQDPLYPKQKSLGLKTCSRKGSRIRDKHVICKGDKLNVIFFFFFFFSLQKDSYYYHWSIRHIINETKIILNSFSNWVVTLTIREADFVVRWTLLNCLEGMIPISFSPDFCLRF